MAAPSSDASAPRSQQFWAERWDKGETKWQVDEKEHNLHAEFYSFLTEHGVNGTESFFVPLCGESPILDLLYSAGHTVIGVEFVEAPVLAFMKRMAPLTFKEEVLIPSPSGSAPHLAVRYTSSDGRLVLHRGDLFAVGTAPNLKYQVDWIWDRASLVAIAPTTRVDYAKVMHSVLKPTGRYFLAVFERDDDKGPPFCVTHQQVRDLFVNTAVDGHAFKIDVDRHVYGMRDNRLLSCLYLLSHTSAGAGDQKHQPVPKKMVGGFKDRDVNDDGVKRVSAFAVEQINAASSVKYRLVKTLQAESQVVAGANYRLKLQLARDGAAADQTEEHGVTVWDNLGKMHLTAHHPPAGTASAVAASDSKVSAEPHPSDHAVAAAKAGGWKVGDSKDEGIAKAAEFAVNELNSQSNSVAKYELREVVSAEVQVVAGLNYKLYLVLARGASIETHHVVVWDRFGKLKLTHHTVAGAPAAAAPSAAPAATASGRLPLKQGAMVGGWKEADIKSEKVQNALTFAVEQVKEKTGKALKLHEVKHATQQLVAGMNYKFTLVLLTENGGTEDHDVTVYDHFGKLQLTHHAQV